MILELAVCWTVQNHVLCKKFVKQHTNHKVKKQFICFSYPMAVFFNPSFFLLKENVNEFHDLLVLAIRILSSLFKTATVTQPPACNLVVHSASWTCIDIQLGCCAQGAVTGMLLSAHLSFSFWVWGTDKKIKNPEHSRLGFLGKTLYNIKLNKRWKLSQSMIGRAFKFQCLRSFNGLLQNSSLYSV